MADRQGSGWDGPSLGDPGSAWWRQPSKTKATGDSKLPQVVSAIGAVTTTAGALIGAVGAFYGAKAAREQQRAQASALNFQATMANINARQAEDDARAIMRSASHEKSKVQLAKAQAIGQTRTSAAARGVSVGTGSAAEVEASQRVIAEIDERTINRNAIQAATSRRRDAINARTQAAMARAGASSAARTARGISPGLAAGTSLLSTGPRALRGWAYYGERYS